MTVTRLRDRRTADAARFKASRLSDASLLYLQRGTPYDPAAGGAERDETSEFEVDLRVGAAWSKRWQDDKPQYYSVPDTGLTLPPGGTAIIEVDEEISVPANRFGIVFPKARLAFQTGIYPFTTKVDPTYSGYLKLFVHNYTHQIRTLKRGDAIASLVLLTTDHAVPDERTHDPRATTKQPRRLTGPWFGYLLWNPTWSATIASIAGGLIVLLISRLLG